MSEKNSHLAIIVILVVSLITRIAWMATRSLLIENEGGEYAAIAENLLAGRGYVGLGLTGKPQLLFPPLYPFSIALTSFITPNTEFAGRVVSLLMGLGLVFVMFKLAALLYGRTVGLLTATLIGLHPLLVRLSVSVQSEATYFALVLSAIYCFLKSLDGPGVRWVFAAGAACGLAYLTRPEAILFPLVLSGYLCVVAYLSKQSWRPTLTRAFLLLIVFALLATPYMFFLHRHTGRLRVEGKSPVNYLIGQRVMSGMGTLEASYGVDDNLREFGVAMGHMNDYIANPVTPGVSALIPYVARATKYQLNNIVFTITNSASFGKALLFALVILGLFYSAWDSVRTTRELCLLLVLATVSASLFSLQYFQERYVFIFLPFMLLWAAKGIDEFAKWAKQTSHIRVPALQLVLVAFLLILGANANITAACDDFRATQDGCIVTKRAGIWLGQQPPENKVIMDAGTAVPYYARAEYAALPYSSSATAIRYILKKKPDFVVLRGSLRQERPYLEEWLNLGVSDTHFRLVYEAGNAPDDKIKIYRLD